MCLFQNSIHFHGMNQGILISKLLILPLDLSPNEYFPTALQIPPPSERGSKAPSASTEAVNPQPLSSGRVRRSVLIAITLPWWQTEINQLEQGQSEWMETATRAWEHPRFARENKTSLSLIPVNREKSQFILIRPRSNLDGNYECAMYAHCC